MPLFRIVGAGALFISVFALPWWTAASVASILLVRYAAYEIIVAGVLADALYGPMSPAFGSFAFPFTLAALLAVTLAALVKRILLPYV